MENNWSDLSNSDFVLLLNKNGFNISSLNSAQRNIYAKRLKQKLLSSGSNDESAISSQPLLTIASTDELNIGKEGQVENDGPYFAVQITDKSFSHNSLIFNNCKQAEAFCKDHLNARFKIFKELNEAKDFTKESCNEPLKLEQVLSLEGSSFSSVKHKDICSMKKMIESGQLTDIRFNLYSNPRYLISSGDTPVIYQEGSRYNALHLASFKNQPEVCSLILNTLSDYSFLESMYPNDSDWMIEERKKNILDLYLNMPDKSLNETALHFASKFGYIEVVRILVGHPLTDKNLKNKYNETASDIACSRVKNGCPQLINQMKSAIEGEYYTVVLRSEDEPAVLSSIISSQELQSSPFKGEVLRKLPTSDLSSIISQTQTNPSNSLSSPNKPRFYTKDANTTPLKVVNGTPSGSTNTPVRVLRSGGNITSSSLKKYDNAKYVAAVVGPLPLQKMESFHKLIVTCGKTPEEKKKFTSAKKSDSRKGIERVCRELAHRENIEWAEVWDFLECQVNLASDVGLTLFEQHLQKHRDARIISNLNHQKQKLFSLHLRDDDVASDTINDKVLNDTIDELCLNRAENIGKEGMNVSSNSLGDLCSLLGHLSILSNSPDNRKDINYTKVDDSINQKLNNEANNEDDDEDDDFLTAAETSSHTNDVNDDFNDDDEDDDSYFDTSNILFAEEELDVFIYGEVEPSLADIEAYHALEFLEEKRLDAFPNISQWFTKIKYCNINAIKRKPTNNNPSPFCQKNVVFQRPTVKTNLLTNIDGLSSSELKPIKLF